VDVTGNATSTVDASSTAEGGLGGSMIFDNGTGTASGTANAIANATGDSATASISASSLTAGSGQGAGFSGGKGGSVSGTAAATGITYAAVTADLTAGNGGSGTGGAHGGAGGSVAANNDVSGTTEGGQLSLSQTARGGSGGNSDTGTGGDGGSASSTLTVNDLNNPVADQSSQISATVEADGGYGGAGASGDGAGGTATAYSDITGAQFVGSNAYAYAGGTTNAAGAEAKATSIGVAGTGSEAAIESLAEGGHGTTTGGEALAVAQGTGGSGYGTANATTGVNGEGTQVVLAAQAIANVTVVTDATADASLVYGNSAFATTTTPEAVAQSVLAPSKSSTAVKNVLDAAGNTAIKGAFSAAQAFYGVGELGVAHASGGTDSETNTSQLSLTLQQSEIPAGHDLVVGFYGGDLVGSGVTQVILAIDANGTSMSQTFTAAQAVAAFTDNPLSLGALAASGAYDLSIQLTVTTDAAGSGFYGGFIIGNDVPAMAAFQEHASAPAPYRETDLSRLTGLERHAGTFSERW
jgi:hypothetical protein